MSKSGVPVYFASKHPFKAKIKDKQDKNGNLDDFLNVLIDWGRSASSKIFQRNNAPDDIYNRVKDKLGPWPTDGTFILYRKAVMLEVLRVLAGFESSWNWKEGVDVNRIKIEKKSNFPPETMESGIFQISANSMSFNGMGNYVIENIKNSKLRKVFNENIIYKYYIFRIKSMSFDGMSDEEIANKLNYLSNQSNTIHKAENFVKEFNASVIQKEFSKKFVIGYSARLLRIASKHHGPIQGSGINSIYPYLNKEAVKEFMNHLEPPRDFNIH
ncbi:MAG: hypothetical protein OEW48_12635 [Phycisphaerae bacterium]|nr:hypothetical protein [Phycisphaerae bacterium]